MPAARIMVLTTSPFRSVTCWTVPETPARTRVLSSFHLRLGKSGFGACFLCGQQNAKLCLESLFLGDHGSHRTLTTVDRIGQTFDLAPRNGIGFQELGLHFVLVNSHLKETLCLTDLCGCCRKLRLSLLCFSLEFFNLPTRRLHGCFLL